MHYIHNLRFQIISFGFFRGFCGEKMRNEKTNTKQIENVMAASVINQKWNRKKELYPAKHSTHFCQLWCNPSIISTHRTSRSRDLFISMLYTYSPSVCVCVMCLFFCFFLNRILAFQWEEITHDDWYHIEILRALAGWSARIKCKSFNLMRFSPRFHFVVTHILFLSVSFAASFNTQILECYKCEHSWVHAEQKVGAMC